MKIELKDGVVLKDGAPIATHNAETNVVLSPKRLAPPVAKAVKALFEVEPSFDIAPANEETGSAGETAKEAKAPKSDAKAAKDVPPAPAKEAKAPKSDAKAAKDVPPAPAKEAQFGDLTPAYVEWLSTYYPEKAAKQYKGRLPGF